MVVASDLYSTVSSCTNVQVLLVCVKGLIVSAQYAQPPVRMVVRSRYKVYYYFYFSEGIIVHAWYVLSSAYIVYVVSMWRAH